MINSAEFLDLQSGLLAARGFAVCGDRSGGIRAPVPIAIKAGQTLVRFHGDPVKGLRIFDHAGRQRFVRQVFVPGLQKYAGNVHTLRSGDTDRAFVIALGSLPHSPLRFES